MDPGSPSRRAGVGPPCASDRKVVACLWWPCRQVRHESLSLPLRRSPVIAAISATALCFGRRRWALVMHMS